MPVREGELKGVVMGTSDPDAIRMGLAEVILSSYSEAHRCEKTKCWRAAVIMIGTTLEAALLFAVISFRSPLQEMGVVSPHENPATWTLDRLTKAAGRAGWLVPSLTGGSQKFDVTMAIRVVDVIRNLAVHPGRLVRHAHPPDFSDEEQMRIAFEVVDRALLAVCDNVGLRVRG